MITVFTDGSYDPKYDIGYWASGILLTNGEILSITGKDRNTSNNRLELLSVIESIKYIKNNFAETDIKFITDSQYVVGLPERLPKLIKNNFLTSKEKELVNVDLIKEFDCVRTDLNIIFEKIKAHQKSSSDFNITQNRNVDKLSRALLRDELKTNSYK